MFSSGGLTGLHHTCLEDLQRAAQGGCKICISLARKRDRLGPDPDNEQTAVPFLKYWWSPRQFFEKFKDPRVRSWIIMFDSQVRWLPSGTRIYDAIYIHVSFMDEAVPDWWASLSAHVASDLDSQPWRVRREMFPLRPIANNTGHESAIKNGKTWLEHCHQFHNCERSNGLVGSTWYPKRLICLPDSISPRLVETSVEPPDCGYATLSHCWGSAPNFITLTTGNLDDFRKGIPINALPPSFRDAMVICNRLCIRYIWIDSLCIMQDSESDWLLHTEEMSSIYQNCYLNLSFDAAANPREGAFRHRNSDVLQECCAFSTMSHYHAGIKDPYLDIEPLRIALTGGPSDNSSQNSPTDKITGKDSSVDATSVKKRPTRELFKCLIFAPELDFTISTSDLPLSSRGWVVQERLLSPRVLHFTEDRIMWECEESASLHEALPRGILGTGEPFDETLQPFSIGCFLGGKPNLHQFEQFHKWDMIVRKYSGCLLTYPEKDKLVAFAAIAQGFSPVFGEDYYAGHFRQNMPFDLVWSVSKQHSDKKSATKRYPTWSWTSVDSQIIYHTVFDRSLVEVQDVSVSLVDTSHKYGPVKGGQLIMKCLIVRGKLGAYQGHRIYQDIWTVHLQEIVGHDDHFSETELIINLDGPEKEILEDVYFIPVLEFSRGRSKIRNIIGLVLLKQADDFHRRVGSWDARIDFPDLKSGPMFEVVDKYSDCHQVVVIV